MFVTKKDLQVPGGLPIPLQSNSEAPFALPDAGRCLLSAVRRYRGRRSAFSSLPFASVSLGSAPKKEGRTGTEFPAEYCHLSKTGCPVLAGVGARRKKLLGMKNIDVYALGLYVDPSAARNALGSKYSCLPAASLSQNQDLCNDIMEAKEVEKTLRIVITSGMVNHDRFLSSLKESLIPACQQAGDTESLPKFEQLFDGTEFRKGLELAFTSTKSGGLAAKIDNKDVGEISAPKFTTAFFSLYLGNKPVSPEGKANISQGLADILSDSAQKV